MDGRRLRRHRILRSQSGEAFVSRPQHSARNEVLDVACGTGNTAIPAARAGASVTGVDIAPNLLEQARARAAKESLTIQFDEGDAENLTYPDASFDVVVSMFGAMFAPRPEVVAAELLRVCRPAAPSQWPIGRPEVSLARCSRRLPGTYRRRPESRRQCYGATRRPSGSASPTALASLPVLPSS